MFITGYSISSVEGIINYFYKFEKLIGLDKIVLFHVNDSKYEIFSKNISHAGIGYNIFKDFQFLYDKSLTENEILSKLKLQKKTNLNIIKAISNYMNIPIIIEDGVVVKNSEKENYVFSQLYVYNSLNYKYYNFDKIINYIYYKIILSEFKRLKDIYDTLGDKRENNCQNIINLLYSFKDYNWCHVKYCDGKLIVKASNVIYDDLIKIKGFGDKTIKKIIEIIENKTLGSISKLESSAGYKSILSLKSIPMIGSVTAKKLLSLGIKNFDDLKVYIKGNNKVLNNSQKKVIEISDKIVKNIGRKEVKNIIERIDNNIKDIEYYFLGSYARNDEFISDIDILIISDNNDDKTLFLKSLSRLYDLIYVIDGAVKSTVFIKVFKNKYLQIDIIIKPFTSKFESILYFTGPKEFNVWIRKIAKLNGFKLSEYELCFDNKKIKLKNEKDIFKHLKINYIEPSQRSLFKIL